MSKKLSSTYNYHITQLYTVVFHGSEEYLDFLNTLYITSDFPAGRWKKANSSTDGAYEPVTSYINNVYQSI